MRENIVDVEKILIFMKENKFTKIQFAKECSMSVSTLNKILSNKTNINILFVFKIARRMDLHIKNLIV